MRTRAFTLIELLVVIAIIGILSAVVMVSLNIARENGRLGAGKSFEANVKHGIGDQMIGEWEFEEPSGTTVIDGSGFGANGTIVGTASRVPGISGQAISSAVYWRANVPSISIATLVANGFTLSAWVQTTEYPGGWRPVFRSTTGVTFWFGKRSGDGEAFFDDTTFYTGGAFSTSGVNIADGKWHQVAWVWDKSAGYRMIYVDGALKARRASTAGAGDPATYGTLRLGGGDDGGFWNGQIDTMRVYTKALTAEAIRKEYAADAAARAIAVQ